MTRPAPALPLVAIVGRPNVGKSTLFNRIVGRRTAIVDDRPGVTRDRLAATADWAGRAFQLVDTGGLVPGTREELERQVAHQVEAAIRAADVILFVVDARSFWGLCEQAPNVTKKIMKAIGQRLRRVQKAPM